MNTKLIVRYAIRDILSLVGTAVALFWSAGRLDWWQAWAALAVMAAWLIATAWAILRFNPDLLAERLDSRKAERSWDTAIVSMLGLLQLIRYIVAGLDQRHGWSSGIAVRAQWISLIVSVLGYALFIWALASNAYFARYVRIQSERGQAVVDRGPYRFLRHPGYAGAIPYEIAASILLGSWWSLIPGGITVSLFILRTALEDRALRAELAGYDEYSRRVRYRLVPGIW